MSLKHLKIDAEVEQTNIDTLPGSDFTVPTGLYEMIISSAYVLASANGSEGLHFTLKPADGSRQEVRSAYYMTGGKEKGGNPYYINPQGKKQYLKGFVQANHLAQIACGKPVADLKEEEKTLKLWNSANRAEENTKVRWLPELVGKPVLAAILRVRQNRKRPVNGKWIKLPTEQIVNEVDKVLFPSGHALTEKAAGQAPTFKDRWVALYPAGETIDRYEKVDDLEPAVPGASEENSLTEEGITSLFGSN